MPRPLRRKGFVARYGGEEFLVLIPDSSLHNAQLRAERVLQSLAKLEIETGEGKIPITVSIGLASLAPVTPARAGLRVQTPLYEATSAGRNCVRVAREKGSALVAPKSLVPGPRSSRSL